MILSNSNLSWGETRSKLFMLHHHFVALHKKLSLHITLLRQLPGSGWGDGPITLHISALFLAYLTAEYCHQSGVASHTHLAQR